MGLSLNKIVSILSDRVGQPFSVALQKELKDIVIYKTADYTKQFLDRNPLERAQFVYSFIVEMEEVAALECDVSLDNCVWYRSTCELPQPIRSKSIIWDFVGVADYTESYGYLAPEFVKYHKTSKYIKGKPVWFWQNKKLVVINVESIKHLGIRGILADPRLIKQCACADTQNCFDDSTPFPMADDILNSIIRDILNVELRNMFPEPATVKVNEPIVQGGGR